MADQHHPVPRAEVVGSLLQPEFLLRAREAYDAGSIGPDELREAEDAAVAAAVELQEAAGVDVVTDGEMRRRAWSHTVGYLEGIVPMDVPRSYPANPGASPAADPSGTPLALGGSGAVRPSILGPSAAGFPTVSSRIRPKTGVALRSEFRFLLARAHRRAKYTMAAPSYHRRYWSDAVGSASGYDSCEEFLTDVRDWMRETARRLVAQGCTYLQLDAPSYGTLCDPRNVAWHTSHGHDVDRQLAFDAALDSSVFEGLEVTGALHICRGNLPGGSWHSAGGYAAIAPQVFPNLQIDVVLLEYDSDRAGDFAPIRLIPEGTVVVLGLLTTKDAALEDPADLVARISEATRSRPLEQLAVSTQCGFASAANAPMSAEEQRAKLELVGRLARQVWS